MFFPFLWYLCKEKNYFIYRFFPLKIKVIFNCTYFTQQRRTLLNILFYRYGSICEPDIIESFQTLGYTVYEHDTEIYDKNPVVGQIVNSISEFIQLHSIDCIFSINFFPILSEICKIYRIRYISWVVDAPVLELYAPSIKNTCNRTFIFDYT